MSTADIPKQNTANVRLQLLRAVLSGFLATPRLARTFVLLIGVSLLASCGTLSSRGGGSSSTGIAVIGVVAKTGLGSRFNKNRMAADFAAKLAERGKFPVLRASSLRQVIGAQRHEDMLRRYSDRGQLAQQDVQMLMAAGLPTQHAIILRVDEDHVVNLPAAIQPVLNSAGAVLVDRERRAFGTQRITGISALIVNLRNGKQRWSQRFEVDPVTVAYRTEYLGSSFTGSLAAAFANTMVNGVSKVGYPDAPSLQLSLESLLNVVAESQPVR